MRAERLGSYSIAATLAGTPSLRRLKSMTRYRRLCPPPMWRVVIRPRLLRPPVLVIFLVSDFSGRSRVTSSKSEVVTKRRPGDVGLYLRMPTSANLPQPPVRGRASRAAMHVREHRPARDRALGSCAQGGRLELPCDPPGNPRPALHLEAHAQAPSKSSMRSPALSSTMAFFQPGRRPRVSPRRLGLLRTLTVRTPTTVTSNISSTAWRISTLWAPFSTRNVYWLFTWASWKLFSEITGWTTTRRMSSRRLGIGLLLALLGVLQILVRRLGLLVRLRLLGLRRLGLLGGLLGRLRSLVRLGGGLLLLLRLRRLGPGGGGLLGRLGGRLLGGRLRRGSRGGASLLRGGLALRDGLRGRRHRRDLDLRARETLPGRARDEDRSCRHQVDGLELPHLQDVDAL